MRYAKVKDEQFRVIEDVVRGRDTFVSLPTGYGARSDLLWAFVNLTSYRFERYEASHSQSRQKGKERETMSQPILIFGEKQARRPSPATPTHARRSSSGARGPTTPGRGRAASSTPPSAFTTKSRGKHAHFDKLTSPIDDPSSLPV